MKDKDIIKTESIKINNINFLVKTYFENRNNSMASIRKNSINIRIPFFLHCDQKVKEVLKLKLWAKERIKKNIHKFKPQLTREYKNNDVLKIGNKKYVLHINYKDKKSSSARLIMKDIYLSISSALSKNKQNKHISTLLSRVIGKERLPKLQDKIITLNKKYFNSTVNKISFKHLRSRWGSCSTKGNINISTRLLFAPDDVLEYVCIHELAHLIQHNHSENFWALVEKAMPDYKEKKKWLKKNSENCNF